MVDLFGLHDMEGEISRTGINDGGGDTVGQLARGVVAIWLVL